MAVSTGIYASDGSWRVTVISNTSSTYVGLSATDGSYNVVSSTGTNWVGIHHPCGAYWVTPVTAGVNSLYANDGSYNVSTSPYQTGVAKITIVSGSFTTIPGVPATIVIFQGY